LPLCFWYNACIGSRVALLFKKPVKQALFGYFSCFTVRCPQAMRFKKPSEKSKPSLDHRSYSEETPASSQKQGKRQRAGGCAFFRVKSVHSGVWCSI